jgi:hypothetical protein
MNRDEDFRPLDWAARQVPRTEAEQWWRSGLTLGEALRWRERFGVEETARWRKAGIRTPKEARSWQIAGVGVDEVSGWLEAGIGFAEASAWHEFGYELAEARRLKTEGKTPSESFRRRVQKMSSSPAGARIQDARRSRRFPSGSAGPAWASAQGAQRFIEKVRTRPGSGQLIQGFLQRQWLDDEALVWATQGIDAADALVWKEFGISPADAAAAKNNRTTVAATLRSWWEAGIPPDEVGVWIGAGFTPEEATAQRAEGVSADRAAVLRALRALEEP